MKFDCSYSELINVDSPKLIPNPKNNNRHSIEQLKQLSKIIDYQGQRSPIVISKRSGFIIKGHGRLEAIKLLGWEKIAVDYQDYKDEAQEYSDMTADNEIARWAELDYHMMMEDIKSIPDLDTSMLGLKKLEIRDWDSGLDDLDNIDETDEGLPAKITVTCPQDLKDEVLIYMKAKFMETSFEGVHIE